MHHFILGATAMAFWIAALFFLRFWTSTRDRLFLIFSGSFALLGSLRLALVFTRNADESQNLYWIRLAAYLLILFAIIDKNRPRARDDSSI